MLIESKYGKFNYILYTPQERARLPLIVILHGSGEVGSNLSKLKKREPYISLKKNTIIPNAIILMPQLPTGSWGKSASTLKKLINYIVIKYNCNACISITGHSLGGAGVMDMLLKYPDYFYRGAALSPCKTYIKKELSKIAHIPIWLFYGEREGKFGKYARQIKNRLGDNAKLTCVRGKGHAIQSCWVDLKYNLFNWLVEEEA